MLSNAKPTLFEIGVGYERTGGNETDYHITFTVVLLKCLLLPDVRTEVFLNFSTTKYVHKI